MIASVPRGENGAATQDVSRMGYIAVIEDDCDTRQLLCELLAEIGFYVQAYAGAMEFLAADCEPEPSCILLDIHLPGMNGLDLQERLQRLRYRSMVIFMTAFADVGMSVRAMKAGAFDFLEKPFRVQDVLDAVSRADAAYDQRFRIAQTIAVTEQRLNSLTGRERQVLSGVVDGLLNKQIAFTLGISEVMVKMHRGNLMRKMQVRNLAGLIRQLSVYSSIRDQVSSAPLHAHDSLTAIALHP